MKKKKITTYWLIEGDTHKARQVINWAINSIDLFLQISVVP